MVTGEVKKILTQKDNDWGRYEIANAGKKTLVVGIIPNVSIGMIVSLDVVEEVNKYGKQLKIINVLTSEADKYAGARKFLVDGFVKHIGATKAAAMVKAYGAECLDMFETPEGRAMLSKVKGVSEKILDKAMPSYLENKKYKDIVLFLNGIGTKHQIEKIYDKYGDEAVKVLKQNPYRLQMDLDGFGFKRADAIAQASGIKPDSVYRVSAAIKYIIEEAQNTGGHCFLTINEIKQQTAPVLVPLPKFKDISEIVANNALKEWPDSKEKLIKAHDPSAETLQKLSEISETRELINNVLVEALSKAIEDGDFVNDDGRIYTVSMYKKETETAQMIAKMCNQHPVCYMKKEVIEEAIKEVEARKTKELKKRGSSAPFLITQEQRDAVYLALMHRISIISGGPGRGKTAISEIVAQAFIKGSGSHKKSDIIMLAPTGRAAQRITESTGYDAMTAHRAVLSMRNGYDVPRNKLILCDETSMVDIYLMHSIMEYAKYCNLIFVGDVDQIASVGPGRVLRDMIESKAVPCILLKQGHRNSGTIAHNSELINAGLKIDKYCYDEHFVYIPGDIDFISNAIVNDYIKKVEQYGIKNVMLCAAMKERGPVAVNKLNKILQEHYTKGNKQASYSGDRIFRVGDRVMQTKNDYSFVKRHNGKEIEGVFNGEKGTVVSVTYDEEEESYNLIVEFDDGSFGGYTRNTVVNLTLAYATTLHKCQGSEAACMMMAYTYGDYMLLNRSLFYTGETRAKKEFRFYGEEKYKYGTMLSAFDIAVSKTDDAKRNTALAERIVKEINE